MAPYTDPQIQQALAPGSQWFSQFPDAASAQKALQQMQADYDAKQAGTYNAGPGFTGLDRFGRPNVYGMHYTQDNANSSQLAPDFDPGPLIVGLGTAALGVPALMSGMGGGGGVGSLVSGGLKLKKGIDMALGGGGGGGGTGGLNVAGLDPQTAQLLSQLLGQNNNPLANLSGVLGGAGAGQAAQRGLQGSLAGEKAGAQQTQYQDALQQALLKQLQAPQTGAEMARRGDLMANVQDVKANFTPGQGYSFSGGLRPSALGPNARAAGAALSNQGLNVAQGGLNLPASPDLTSGFPSTTPGGLEQGLQYGALGSGILSSITGNNGILQRLMGGMGGGNSGIVPGVSDPSQIVGGLTGPDGSIPDLGQIDPSQIPGFDPNDLASLFG